MNALNRFADPFYCIMRLVVGLMFACHGLDKIFGAFNPKGEALPTLMVVGGWVETRLRISHCLWSAYASRRVHRLRRNGGGVFHDACAEGSDSLS